MADEAALYFTPAPLFGRLHEAMVPVPRVEPGDSVWWHPDMIHRFELYRTESAKGVP